ncbi:disulfide oxidoreductase YuzD [Rhizobium leguminosarum]|uniref:Disulfide oxidoreductase YuzD n=1 Tax=Rhizobium leguminosarum TaxID=384 RepID=A0A7Z0DVZ1_RHILE|nr:disulfide oxidoreductase YuzD [Rhizobium leguminosarum]
MMKLCPIKCAACVAMGIDMDKTDWLLPADGLQNRMADRMIASDGKRGNAGINDLANAPFDVVVAELQPVTALERNVADVGDPKIKDRGGGENVIVRADPFDGAKSARSETRTRTVGDTEIHRDSGDCDLEIAEVRLFGSDLHIGCAEESWHSGIWRQSRAVFGDDLLRHFAKRLIEYLAAIGVRKFRAQLFKPHFVPHHRHASPLWFRLAQQRG